MEQDCKITTELLIKYDRPGPRYTSYPTVPEWDASFGPADYAEALREASADASAPLSLYVHIPFCSRRCAYCGCNTAVPEREEEVAAYLAALDAELGRLAEALGARRTLAQLHWGGGTPTSLTQAQIDALFEGIASRFTIEPGAEVSIEADPRVTTRAHVEQLARLGFNRVSMGVQDLAPRVQEAIGRGQTAAQTRALLDACREAGFEGVNMDLVYGLPGQDQASWADTMRDVAAMKPSRLAVYSFAYLPKLLPHQAAIDAEALPAGPQKYALFAAARQTLLEAGYRAIGMDHFALPGDALARAMDARRLNRNFMGYTPVRAEDMAGVGASAIGEIAECYAQNAKATAVYNEASSAGFATVRGRRLTRDDRIRRWTIRQLMCNFHLDKREFETRFGAEYAGYFAEEQAAVRAFAAEGFVEDTPEALLVRPLGRVFVRNVAMVFDAYLKRKDGRGQFSRTV